MAQQMTVHYVDDLDGSEATATVPFGVDGYTYEIDLSDENAMKLRDALAPFVEAARHVSGRKPTRPGGTAPAKADPGQTRAMREWARSNGFKVSDRGRVPSEVIKAYHSRDAAKPATTDTVKGDATPSDQPVTLSVVPDPFQADPAPDSDDAVLAWWTGVKKKPAPKGNKVSAPMRREFRAEVLDA